VTPMLMVVMLFRHRSIPPFRESHCVARQLASHFLASSSCPASK
jgi:hypothetical protein